GFVPRSKGAAKPETSENERIPAPDRIHHLSGLEDSIDGINESLEDALFDYRQAHVPDAMPDHRGRDRGPVEIIPEDDFALLLKARMAAKYGGEDMALSNEARATVRPSITGSRR
ncbi:hypothetical protein, partial [Methylorubrum zatmanii]